MFNTKYYIEYNSKHTNSCYVFSFLHNFKLKSHVAEFSFQILQYVQKNTIYCLYIDTKCDDKDFRQFKQ